MRYKEIISKVSDVTGLPKGFVDRTYRAYWKIVREHITSLPLKEDITDEEFLKIKPNVNIPSIGKLYVPLERYKTRRKDYKEYQELKAKKYGTAHQEN